MIDISTTAAVGFIAITLACDDRARFDRVLLGIVGLVCLVRSFVALVAALT